MINNIVKHKTTDAHHHSADFGVSTILDGASCVAFTALGTLRENGSSTQPESQNR